MAARLATADAGELAVSRQDNRAAYWA